jgi:pimeloyl-ACP methyl ester carboxylesterase
VLISPQIYGWEWSEQWRDDWQAIVVAARAGRLAEARELWWRHPIFETTRGSPAAGILRDEIDRFGGEQWIVDRHALVMPDIERLHELHAPTLLVTGSRDVDELRLMADVLAASVEGIERVEVDGGHLLQLEAPEICAHRITGFLAAV